MLRRALAAPLGALLLTAAVPAGAETLQDALAQAYSTNPQLESARALLRSTDELVPQARSGFLPTVTAEGNYSRQRISASGQVLATSPHSVNVVVNQNIYAGGGTISAVRRAENLVKAQRATLLNTEQQVLLAAATAYANTVRDQAVVELNANNEQVLRRQLEASRDRFRVGEITRTDVSQSESRLSRASADRILAQGQLNATRANYLRIIGTMPGSLEKPVPPAQLPGSAEDTVALARENNPLVVAARYTEDASREAIDQERAQLLPQVGVTGSYSRNWDQLSLTGQRYDSAAVVARVTVPLYEAGGVTARVRAAKQTASQRRMDLQDAVLQANQAAVQGWEALTTARASVEARKQQVRAAEIALEGVRQEATVGSRTVLDVLDAEQELLDSRVSLVRDENAALVAAFQVLAAIGRLDAGTLNLPVKVYDPQSHYDDVHNKLWGTGID
jgi:outer membrane protein/adhesin transport system outer membrane protein